MWNLHAIFSSGRKRIALWCDNLNSSSQGEPGDIGPTGPIGDPGPKVHITGSPVLAKSFFVHNITFISMSGIWLRFEAPHTQIYWAHSQEFECMDSRIYHLYNHNIAY